MKYTKRSLNRFRAGIYAGLPKCKIIRKLGMLAVILSCLTLYLRLETESLKGENGCFQIEYVQGNVTETGYLLQNKEQMFEVTDQNFPKAAENKNAAEAVGNTETAEVIGNTETAEVIGNTETAEVIGNTEAAEVIGNTEAAESVGIAETTEMADLTFADIIDKRYLLSNLKQLDYLKDTFYIVNQTTKMTESDFCAERLLSTDLRIEKKAEAQILIYHTHASEAFLDSREGYSEDTVVGMGELLKKYLTQKYGYVVIHDTTVFDRKNGADHRSYAYNDALPYIEQLLSCNPGIEVIIDLHRDAGAKRVSTIQGKQVARVMLFNGLCRNTEGEIAYLSNKNLSYNLAFSFQMKLIGDEMYPGLMNRIFLKDYRYNMHLAKRYLLVELGTQNNTVEEAANAMEPLADVLAHVLSRR